MGNWFPPIPERRTVRSVLADKVEDGSHSTGHAQRAWERGESWSANAEPQGLLDWDGGALACKADHFTTPLPPFLNIRWLEDKHLPPG